MNYKLKTPCKNCPFRKDLPKDLEGWFGKSRAQQIADDVLKHGFNFACHKTTTHSDDGDEDRSGYLYTEKESQCAGAAIMQIKDNNPSQWMQISTRMGLAVELGIDKLELNAPVFDTAKDFIAFHSM